MPAMPSTDPDGRVSMNRRGFLGIMSRAILWLAGGAAVAAVGRYLAYEPPQAADQVTLEAPQAYPAGGMTLVAAGRAALYRDSGGFFARSLTCRHLGCRVQPDVQGGFACPCHGSHYDRQGDRLTGPAPGDLNAVALSLDSQGNLVVDLNRPVADTWRLATASASRGASSAPNGG
jgi:cytochrome b6-f complex iron-sulfur subunit